MKILDCTLRDGGYYTNWDFDSEFVSEYFQSMEKLPIEYVEIGYRSVPQKEYCGEYFFCPAYVLQKAKTLMPHKKLAIMLNEKDTCMEDIDRLLGVCQGYIDMVRMAVSPVNIERAMEITREIKKHGFKTALNVMYLSQWAKDDMVHSRFKQANDSVDYFYMVDSFGGILPKEVETLTRTLKKILTCKIGFHGHNNTELAFANALAAIEGGADIIDATITGIGRGAGNLKTELLLVYLSSKGGVDIDFNALSNAVAGFEQLQRAYLWGTNLPYMVSGANSLPQKDVMEWTMRKIYSINCIVRALNNMKEKKEDNIKLPTFNQDKTLRFKTVLIVGGGESPIKHSAAIKLFIEKHKDDICIIHASTKNAWAYQDMSVPQFYCLVGNEGHRMEKVFRALSSVRAQCILPAYPREMGTYIPAEMQDRAYELREISFTDKYTDSHSAIALQTAIDLKSDRTYVVGYDGYSSQIGEQERALINENEYLFSAYRSRAGKLISLTATNYKNIPVESIFGMI